MPLGGDWSSYPAPSILEARAVDNGVQAGLGKGDMLLLRFDLPAEPDDTSIADAHHVFHFEPEIPAVVPINLSWVDEGYRAELVFGDTSAIADKVPYQVGRVKVRTLGHI